MAKLRGEGKIVLVVASSGIAALLLTGGRTAHYRFKIPLELTSYSTCNIKKGTNLASLIRECSLIIWDEAPMCHRHCFEALDRTLRDILHDEGDENNDLPFGGKPVILGGDFRQILPVIPNGSREDIVDASIANSYMWKHVHVFTLEANMRLSDSGSAFAHEDFTSFGEWLLALGDGQVQLHSNPAVDTEENWITLPKLLVSTLTADPIMAIIAETYPDFEMNYKLSNYLQERAIVTPRNETAKHINDRMLGLAPGNTRTYYSCDSLCKTTMNLEEIQTLYPIEFLNSINPYGFPSHEISLKINTPHFSNFIS